MEERQDLISRQAALDAITDELMPSVPLSAVIRAKNRLKALSAVQPDHNADIGKKVEAGDCISRQAAIEAVEKSMYENPHENEIHRGMHDHEHRHFLTILMGLPSAQPPTNCSEIPNGSDDTISRQAAVDLFPDDDLEYDTKGGYIAPHLARQMICELPSVQPDLSEYSDKLWKSAYERGKAEAQDARWIPCSDRLPEEDHWLGGSGKQFSDNVLISITNREDEDTWSDISQTIDGKWALELPRHCEITAWRPLPEPYRGGGKE